LQQDRLELIEMQVESGDLLELSGVEAAGELLAANVNYQDHLRALMKRVYEAQQRTKQLQVTHTSNL
jgi:hypothetical protein